MNVNEIQVGGDHYRMEYIHWDFVCDTRMPYLLGCATKYVARHKEKNGVEDLRKSTHYLAKAEDRGIYMPVNKWYENHFPFNINVTTEDLIDHCTKRFASQLPHKEAHIIRLIVEGSYQVACEKLAELIDDEIFGDPAEPGSGYTNQDPTNYFRG